MTATTKEHLGTHYCFDLRDGLINVYAYGKEAGARLVASVPYDEAACRIIGYKALSDRLAAIEAVTGEGAPEVVDRCREHLTMSKFLRREHLLERANEDRNLAATALLSLSAKVAEQAEEIERAKDGAVSLHDRLEDAVVRAEAAEAKCKELEEEIADWSASFGKALGGRASMQTRAEAAESERDTLCRLLTETAVPALELAACDDAALGPTVVKARHALSTIRAHMEGGNG